MMRVWSRCPGLASIGVASRTHETGKGTRAQAPSPSTRCANRSKMEPGEYAGRAGEPRVEKGD